MYTHYENILKRLRILWGNVINPNYERNKNTRHFDFSSLYPKYLSFRIVRFPKFHEDKHKFGSHTVNTIKKKPEYKMLFIDFVNVCFLL